jgi:hypothetical protein
MASDTKTVKADAAPKKAEPATKNDAPAAKNDTPAKAKDTSGEGASKAAGAEPAAAPSSYSRGEGQKAVTRAYRENWNAIFAKKNAKKKKR